MANKIKNIKVIYEDGRVGEAIPVGAKASNVELNNGHTVEYEINQILEKIEDILNRLEEKGE